MIKVRFHEVCGDGYIDRSFTLTLCVGAEKSSTERVRKLLSNYNYLKDVKDGYSAPYKEWVKERLTAEGIQFRGEDMADLVIPWSGRCEHGTEV